MNKKVLKGLSKSILVCGLAFLAYSCSVEDGRDGLAGPQGVQGEKGEKGDKGDKGDRGEQGIPGIPGAQGPQGIAGIDGTNGTNGIDGINGTNGTNGIDGINGLQGIPGAVGATGATGLGLEEFETAVGFGYITNSVTGVEVDGTKYSKEYKFRFMNDSPADDSYFYSYDGEDEEGNVVSDLQFYLTRYLAAGDDSGYQYMSVYVDNFGTEDQEISFYHYSDFELVDANGNFVNYYDDVESYDDEMNGLVISEFSFDKVTKNLKFKYSYLSLHTGATVSGTVNVIVAQETPSYIPYNY